MADRTYYRLALPAGLPLDVLADLASTFTGEPCTVQEAADHARPDGIVWVNIEQHPVGACREAAESVLEQLREHGQDVAFTVTEDPAYEWLGTICRYQPGLGIVGGERFWEILASSGQVGQIGHFSGGFWDEPFPQPRLGEAGFRFLVDSPWTDQRQERLTSPRQFRTFPQATHLTSCGL